MPLGCRGGRWRQARAILAKSGKVLLGTRHFSLKKVGNTLYKFSDLWRSVYQFLLLWFIRTGVLDSMELSLLNGSVSLPDDSSLSRNHDVSTTSPFTSSTKIRSNTSRLQPIRETPEMGTQTRRRNIDSSPKSLFSDSNSVAHGQPPIHRVSFF